MSIKDKHLYYGAAIIKIAEDEHFTAINPLELNGVTSQNGFLVNTNVVVYPKYATSPNGSHREYQFNFKQENLLELDRISQRHANLFIPLVCVRDREVCGLTYSQLQNLRKRRAKDVGWDEDQLVVLTHIPKGRQFRVYVNASGTRNQYLGQPLLVPRSAFPAMLFA
jgi:hypothetical protein